MKPTGRVVIAGGTGFLGQNLALHLVGLGCEVVVISRHPSAKDARWRQVEWDARTLGDWVRHLDGAAALVNLAGRTVDCVKTPDHCDEILRSRAEPTALLGRALHHVKALPRVWVQMATAHLYGDPPDVVCDEDSAFGYGLAFRGGRVGGRIRARGTFSSAASRASHELRARPGRRCLASTRPIGSLGAGREGGPRPET